MTLKGARTLENTNLIMQTIFGNSPGPTLSENHSGQKQMVKGRASPRVGGLSSGGGPHNIKCSPLWKILGTALAQIVNKWRHSSTTWWSQRKSGLDGWRIRDLWCICFSSLWTFLFTQEYNYAIQVVNKRKYCGKFSSNTVHLYKQQPLNPNQQSNYRIEAAFTLFSFVKHLAFVYDGFSNAGSHSFVDGILSPIIGRTPAN